jgi:hypothetical protein
MSTTKLVGATVACENCRHFQNDPVALEKTYPGLSALSSAFASVRAQDGICSRHDLYLPAWDHCRDFAPAVEFNRGDPKEKVPNIIGT